MGLEGLQYNIAIPARAISEQLQDGHVHAEVALRGLLLRDAAIDRVLAWRRLCGAALASRTHAITLFAQVRWISLWHRYRRVSNL